MDYEEKLRLAKEALESGSYDKDTIEYIFPELKENNDKKIIKILQNIVKGACSKYGIKWRGVETSEEDLLTWLEKQGKQKSADKTGPKFHEGDWIIFNGLTLLIKRVFQDYYRTISIDGFYNSYDRTIDNAARLWTLQDAKSGDVLADNKRPFIFKGFLDISHPNHPVAYCGINTLGSFISGSGSNWWTNNKDDVKPATKEERELLYREMEKDGYEWNKITKELKKKSS